MKKTIALLFAVLAMAFTAVIGQDCYYNKGISINKTVSCEYRSPVLGPWYDCNLKFQGNLKLKGWENQTCKKDTTFFISDDELRDRGYVPEFFNDFGDNNDLLGWLLGLLLAILLTALLVKLIKGHFDSKAPAPAQIATNPVQPAPSPSQSLDNQNTNQTTVFRERASALALVIDSMKKNGMEGFVDLGEGVNGNFSFKKEEKTEAPKKSESKSEKPDQDQGK